MAHQPYEHVASTHRNEVLHAWLAAAGMAARQLAVVTAAGALVGLLVGGVGGRLAMMLLATLNPVSHGRLSDDGFIMGQLTFAGTVELMLTGVLLGIAGAGFYVALRGLMIGPRWFQVLSISVGPAVVVGAMLVHTEGIDFVLLQPAWLAIALFVAIPGLYAALLTVLAERWLAPGSRPLAANWIVVVVLLLLWVPLAPLLGVLALGWLLVHLVSQSPQASAAMRHPATAWTARAALAAIFALGFADLVRDTQALV